MNLLDLNKELQTYVDSATGQMVADLKPLLLDSGITYIDGKSRDDVSYFHFEYDYEYLDVAFYAIGKDGDRVSEVETLPTEVASKAHADSEWTAFLPEHIWDAVADFEESDAFDDEDAEDLLDEYHLGRCRIFEQWFCACWKQAVAEAGVNVPAYFSVHDSYFKTDLNTLKEVTTDDLC